MTNDHYNNWLASLSPDERASLGNRTQSTAAAPQSSLLPAPNLVGGLLATDAMPVYQSPMVPPQPSASPSTAQPSPTGGLLDPNIANAGVSIVPQFTPPTATQNLAAQIHRGFLSNILHKVGGAINNAVSPDLGYAVDDTARHNARSAGYLALGNSLLNPQLDARGFRQSTLGSIASGLQAGREASAQAIGGAVQAAQYGTSLAQNQRTQAARLQVGPLLAPRDGEDPNGAERRSRLVQAEGALLGVGDVQGARDIAEVYRAMGPFNPRTPPERAPTKVLHVMSPVGPNGEPSVRSTALVHPDGTTTYVPEAEWRPTAVHAGAAAKTPAQQAATQFGVVQKQIGLATSEIAAKQRELNSSAVLLDPSLAVPIRQRIAELNACRDSLSGVADHLASTVQGSTPASPPTHAAPRGVPAHVTAAYENEANMYQRAAQSITNNAAFSPAERSTRLAALRDRYNHRIATVVAPTQ